MTRVALVTATSARHLDDDLPPLKGALLALQITPEVVVWDDTGVDWTSFPLAVVRSAWDYVPRREEFLAWAERTAAATTLVNPPTLLRWTTDKRYLRDLEAAGVPVVTTSWLEPGDPVELVDDEVVVKPVVGAGSVDTERYRPERRVDAADHARRLLDAGRAVMVQPYLDSVDDHGETALVFFGGRFSHAVRKGPILRLDGTVFVEGLYAKEEIERRVATPDEIAVATAALDAVPGAGPPLYARVDVVPGPAGSPVVLELELAEPSVFLDHDDGAAGRFGSAIAEALARDAGPQGPPPQ